MTTLWRPTSWLALLALFLTSPPALRPAWAQSTADLGTSRFDQWLAAIEAHHAGDPGKAAVEVSTWSGADLEAVIAEAKRHARTLARKDVAGANRILLRGADLHADIARLIPDETTRRSPNQKSVYIVRDGRWTGRRFVSIHWQLGRSLLDAITAEPSATSAVQAWYRSTSVDLLRLRSLAEAVDHLARARQVAPADATVLFCSGVLHERFSSMALQSAAASLTDEHQSGAAIESPRGELNRAERFLRDAISYRPGHIEARIRHGHVLGDLGRHEEASAELRRAIADGADGALLYLAQLFLGRQEEALGRPGEARAAYERAAELYPAAQSARLALSHLARRSGDRLTAQREIRRLEAPAAGVNQPEDPWWNYYDVR